MIINLIKMSWKIRKLKRLKQRVQKLQKELEMSKAAISSAVLEMKDDLELAGINVEQFETIGDTQVFPSATSAPAMAAPDDVETVPLLPATTNEDKESDLEAIPPVTEPAIPDNLVESVADSTQAQPETECPRIEPQPQQPVDATPDDAVEEPLPQSTSLAYGDKDEIDVSTFTQTEELTATQSEFNVIADAIDDTLDVDSPADQTHGTVLATVAEKITYVHSGMTVTPIAYRAGHRVGNAVTH